jgi:cytochrome c2
MKNLFFLTTVISFVILITGCNGKVNSVNTEGTTWGNGSFSSNGQRIYFTATSERGTEITYTGGPVMGMMMMGGRLACVSCHGVDATGGKHMMHMEIMDAPDIRLSTLSSGQHAQELKAESHDRYEFDDFKNSVEYGKHPDGDILSNDMPRWHMNDSDLKDLMNYLETLK